MQEYQRRKFGPEGMEGSLIITCKQDGAENGVIP